MFKGLSPYSTDLLLFIVDYLRYMAELLEK